MSLEEFEITPERLLDKSTVLLGPSGSGKSTIIIDILYHLKPYVDQAVVFSPMDKQNNTFGVGVLPRPLIHYQVSAEVLDDLWDRQAEFVSLYRQANRLPVLEKLFSRVPEHRAGQLLKAYEGKMKKIISALEPDDPRADKIKANYDEFRARFYKKYIAKHAQYLSKIPLSTSESISLKNIHFNPRIVVIFDDCTDILKKMKGTRFIQNVFYQGRWSMMTIIMGLHTDKVLDPEIKKSIFNTIYTRSSTALACLNKESSGLSKEGRQRAIAATHEAITPLVEHQVLVYTNTDDKYWKFKATVRKGFKFCSPAIWALCDAIATDENESVDFKKSKYIRDII